MLEIENLKKSKLWHIQLIIRDYSLILYSKFFFNPGHRKNIKWCIDKGTFALEF